MKPSIRNSRDDNDSPQPSSTKRIRLVPTPANPVGIRNLGSTGYLSVVLQTFYFITAIPQVCPKSPEASYRTKIHT